MRLAFSDPFVSFLFGLFFLLSVFVLLGYGTEPLDMYAHDTYMVVAHLHVLLLILNLFGIPALIYLILGRILHRHVNPFLGNIHLGSTLAGVMLVFLPLYLAHDLRNLAEFRLLIGLVLIGIGQIVFILHILYSLLARRL